MIGRGIDGLACFGGTPEFSAPIPVGQVYLPEWDDFKAAFDGIFERRFFTNHGPLVREMDERFAAHLGVRHAVCVSNATVGLMVAAKALGLRGKVVLPAFTFPATVQAMLWAGLTPVFCDVEQHTHVLDARLVEPLLDDPEVTGVLGVHLWGRACAPDALSELCAGKPGVSLFFDAAHAIDCTHHGRRIGGLGRVEVFSFHATKILNGAEGGCLTTNDDELAEAIRTVRNFHLSESFCQVPLRINGKMSEAQAAMALLGLRGLAGNIARNRDLYGIYRERSRSWPALRLIEPDPNEENNYQYCVFELAGDARLNRDALLLILNAENVLARRYFYPGMHRQPPCGELLVPCAHMPVTDRLAGSLLQLPMGAAVDAEGVRRICDLMDLILRHADEIGDRLARGAA